MPAAAFLIALLVAAPAAASGAKDDADAAISRGLNLRRQGNDAAALEEFQRAKTMSPSPRAAAQVGLALQALGRWAEAEVEVDEALHSAGDAWIIKNRSTLASALATIREHVGSLEILGTPAGAEVFVEQRRVGVLPLARPVRATAGAVALDVRASGYLPVTRNVLVKAGTLSRENVNLTPEATASMPVPGPAGTPVPAGPAGTGETDARPVGPKGSGGDWHVSVAWASGIGAAVLLATGVTALVIRGSKSDQLAQKVDRDHTCSRSGTAFSGSDAPACVDLATAKDTWTGIAVGTLIGAGVAGAASAVLVATRARQEGASAVSAVQPVRVGVVVDRSLTFVFAGWRF